MQSSEIGSALKNPTLLSMRMTMPRSSPVASNSPPPLIPFAPLMPEKMSGTGTPWLVHRVVPMTPETMRGGSSACERSTTPTVSPMTAGLARIVAKFSSLP